MGSERRSRRASIDISANHGLDRRRVLADPAATSLTAAAILRQNRAAEVAPDLILREDVEIVITSTPDTTMVESLSERGDKLSSEVWWSPHRPFKFSLTGASVRALASSYMNATGRPWTQPIGFKHALFEGEISRAQDPENSDGLVAAIAHTKLDTIVGAANFSKGPVKNVTKTPLVGGPRREDGDLNLEILANAPAPEIPVTAEMKLL
ncbi:hypothetical protein [Chelativorans alearense]|uniref:hypothetical protein n=1 Tax=Chelativorans alearense TaxID=2681495 RepID=UPI0013D0FD1B|nr:hypothetical protein [Chelativorans alearense]